MIILYQVKRSGNQGNWFRDRVLWDCGIVGLGIGDQRDQGNWREWGGGGGDRGSGIGDQ